MNILDVQFEGPFNAAPFKAIKTEFFLPSIKRAIKQAKDEIEKIKDPDLTAADMDAAVRTLSGSARSAGIEVEG